MARDFSAGFRTSGRAEPTSVSLAADAAACVAAHAHHAADARLLLDVLGLTDAAPVARALLRMTRKETQ